MYGTTKISSRKVKGHKHKYVGHIRFVPLSKNAFDLAGVGYEGNG
jgi:hypothetical protein